MKAADFRYERPQVLSAALEIMADPEAVPLAGGQSLMPMMNFRLARPETLVDLNQIEELQGISIEDDCVRIGAMTKYASLATSDIISAQIPLFTTALPFIAHEAVRNRGTIGGSVALADPAAEMPALLLALGATIIVKGSGGERRIRADDFFLGMYDTALQPGELVIAVDVPVAAPDDSFGFYELARRHGDYAMAGVAIAKRSDTRIAFFSVAERAMRAPSAEALLTREPAAIDEAIASLAEIEFNSDLNASVEAKQHLAGVVLRRALEGMA